MSKTKIEWCDETVNPIIGCSHSGSPGCDHCYAQRMAHRLGENPSTPQYQGLTDSDGKWTGKIVYNFDPKANFPKHKMFKIPGRGKRIFVGSMTDLFHENCPSEYVDAVMMAVAMQPWHTFILLTKRPLRMLEYFSDTRSLKKAIGLDIWDAVGGDSDELLPLENLWLGVTVCNQEEANAKIPLLLEIPAARHFVSIEPMLGPVSMDEFIGDDRHTTLDWVIVGGETGPGARPMHPAWVRSIRDQCQDADVLFFFKSWGNWCPRSDHPIIKGLSASQLDMDCTKWACIRLTDEGKIRWSLAHANKGEDVYMQRVGKKLAGHLLDGRDWREVPE